MGLAALALYVDDQYEEALEEIPLVLGATVTGGRAVVTTVAGATITVAAIVFSITALSTQMASTQYSPRSLGSFFEDPFQQAIIGLVVGTFAYSVLILAGLSNVLADPTGVKPSLAVTLTIILGVGSAIGIVGYINHSLKRMQIDSVVRRIATSSAKAIRRDLDGRKPDVTPEGKPPMGEPEIVTADNGGWVVDIYVDRLLRALPAQTTARVNVRVGDAVSQGDGIVTVWPKPEDGAEKLDEMRRAIALAGARSVDTDPTFGIRQLADIALRALSPGVNDPTTAIDVLHNLKAPLRAVLTSDPPRRVFSGDRDRRVFLAETPSRSDYVHYAFSEVRLAAGGQPFVLRALIEVLQELKRELDREGLEERAGALQEELELVVRQCRDSDLPEPDLERALRPYDPDEDEELDGAGEAEREGSNEDGSPQEAGDKEPAAAADSA